MGESWLYEAVCRERHELCVRVDYMKLCVERDMNFVESWLYKAVCRERRELWVRVGYMKLCVDRDMNCG